MRLNLRKYLIERAADPKGLRPALHCTWLDVEKKRLYASDSYIMASVPVEVDEGDVSGQIPLAATKQARTNQRKSRMSNAVIDAPEGTIEVAMLGGKMILNRGNDSKPEFKKIMTPKAKTKPVLSIGLNAELAARLQAALGAKQGLRLDIYGPLEKIHVTALGDDEAVGVLMPIRLAR